MADKIDLSMFEEEQEPAVDLSMFEQEQPKQEAAPDVDISMFEQPSETESAVRGLAQGATFGFADEIAGAAEALFTDKSYRQARDESRAAFAKAEAANPKAYLAGEVSGGIASTFVPGLGWLNAGKSALAAAKVGAAAGALTGAGRAKELKDVPGEAAKMGAIGGVGGGAIGAGGRVLGGLYKYLGKSKISPPSKRVMQEMEESLIKAGHANPNARRQIAAQWLDDQDTSLRILKQAESMPTKEFPGLDAALKDPTLRSRIGFSFDAEKVPTKKEARKILEGMTPEQQKMLWQRHQEGRNIMKSIRGTNEQNIKDVLQGDDAGLGWFQKWFDDPQFIARKYDRLFNLDNEGAIASAAESVNRVQVDAAPFLAKIPKLQKLTSKAFPNKKLFAEAMENPNAKLHPDQQKVVNQWRAWYDEARGLLKDRGIEVDYLESYFPKQSARLSEVYGPLKKRVQQAGDDLLDDKDLMNTLARLNEGNKPRSLKEANRIVEGLLSPQSIKKGLGQQASASFRREGADLPKLLREYDPSRVAINYLMGNLKAAHMRPTYDKLYTNVQALRALRADDAADYMTQYFSRMSGQPSDFYAAMQYGANRWRIGIDRLFGDLDQAGADTRALHRFGRAAPDFVDWMSSLIYPNVMGWNIHAPVRNMTQTWMLTAPELGTGYGHKMVAKGWGRAMRERLKTGKNIDEFLQEKGLMADQSVLEGARKAIDSGISQVPGVGQAAKMIDKLGELGMTLYAKSDSANRFLTWNTAQELAKDALAGSKNATKFLNTLPSGLQNKAIKALRQNNQDELGDLLGRYLIRKTQFNYGKAGLSKFGQEYGRVASMFTKWPVMVAGDINELRKTGRAGHAMAKYLMPLVMMAGAHRTLAEMEAYDDPVAKSILGSNVYSWAPATAMTGFSMPPLIETPMKIGAAFNRAAKGDVKKASKNVYKSISPFLPVAGAVDAVSKRYSRKDLYDHLIGDK